MKQKQWKIKIIVEEVLPNDASLLDKLKKEKIDGHTFMESDKHKKAILDEVFQKIKPNSIGLKG